MRRKRELTEKEKVFVREYLVDLKGTQAAIRAGYPVRSAYSQASRILAAPHVQAAIAEARKAREERTHITQDRVLNELWQLATANPNELIEFRRTCCRYCHGTNNDYQRTKREMDRDYEEWEAKQLQGDNVRPFRERGGIGYDARRPPNPDCSSCFGEGEGNAFPKDTRNLSPSALRLYAGVKMTRAGLEIQMHDQQAALMAVGKHLGMFVDKHEHSGKDGEPIQTAVGADANFRDVILKFAAAADAICARGGTELPLPDGNPQSVDTANGAGQAD